MVISKMAAKMAALTLKLAYLLNYLLQISRWRGVSHERMTIIKKNVRKTQISLPGTDINTIT